MKTRIIILAIACMTLSAGPDIGYCSSPGYDVTEDFDEKWEMKVSVEFADTEIYDALRVLATISGLNIVSGPKIVGKVSARLEDVSLREALTSVVRSCNFSYVREGEVIRVVEVADNVAGLASSTPQVLIESRIVEVTLGDEFDSGVDWQLMTQTIEDDLKADGLIDLGLGTTGFFLNIYNGDVDALINLAGKQRKTKVLSAPRVVALDGREARILVGEKVAYQQSFGQASAGITTTSVNFEDVGIKLYVTPHVRPGGNIIIDILVEVSSVKEWRTVSNGDEIPIISTKQTTSQVTVRDGSTLIVGGMIGESVIESVSKIPLLGDIPLLKYLFSRRSREKSKTELTVFITPQLNTEIAASGHDPKGN